MYVITVLPMVGEICIEKVKITDVHEDGSFDFEGRDGQAGWCSPDKYRLYNEDGTPAEIVVTPSASVDAGMLAALQILFGGGDSG